MDVVADFANLRGIGREEALNETLPWMLFCLHRRDVERARHAQLDAVAMNVATATAFGCEGGTRAMEDFCAGQQELINHDPFATAPDPTAPTPQEIAVFEKMQARARKPTLTRRRTAAPKAP